MERCQNMIERVRAEFPDESAPEGVKWQTGDTRTGIKPGGMQAALARLREWIDDESRPWYHGCLRRGNQAA